MELYCLLRLMFLSLVFAMRTSLVESAVVYPSIQWSPRNPIFKENGTVRFVLPMSKINIVCPNPSTVVALSQYSTPKAWLYENLWIVSKKAYDACDTRVDQGSRLLLQCRSPLYLAYYTLVFQQFSATMNGLEFKRDQEYYFIATSTGTRNSLNRTSGGNCQQHNMRLRFRVCRDDKDPRCAHNPPTNLWPGGLGSRAPLTDTTTARVMTSPLPTSRTPSTAERVTTHPTRAGRGTSTERANSVEDTSDDSIKLRRESEQPPALGDIFNWTGLTLLALLVVSMAANVILVHRVVRRKTPAFVARTQDYAYHQSGQGDQALAGVGSVKPSPVLDDRTAREGRPSGDPSHHSPPFLVGVQQALRHCTRKSTSSYNLQTVVL